MDNLDHMRVAIGLLVEAGNPTTDGGLRPTQGGWECGFVHRLDPATGDALVVNDPQLRFDSDAVEISCAHCWCLLFGAVAADRYRAG